MALWFFFFYGYDRVWDRINPCYLLFRMSRLECDGIYLTFGLRKILSSVYVQCERGQIMGLLGRNGSGKSCLLKIIFGAMESESKSVRIDGESILVPFSTSIRYLPQQRFIPSFLKIKEAFGIYNVNVSAIKSHFPELEPYFDSKPDQISGGVLRIFEVLLVAGLPVKFVLLDEPFSGVMPIHIESLKNYLTVMKAEKGIIITDHLYRHITSLTDRMYVLVNGKTYPIKNEEQLIQYGYVNTL